MFCEEIKWIDAPALIYDRTRFDSRRQPMNDIVDIIAMTMFTGQWLVAMASTCSAC